jgi:hypothetical protein
VLVVYAALVGTIVRIDGVQGVIRVGRVAVARSSRSPRISSLRWLNTRGYDGQYAYFIALDPLRARYYLDEPAYRYSRIGYPALAWALAAGRGAALPYTLLAINLFAATASVYLLAGFLRRRSISAWWAAVYGFFPGMITCVTSDLTEPLAYFLVLCGLILYERSPRRAQRYVPCFALAALTRETTVVFPLVVGLSMLLQDRSTRRIAWSAAGRTVFVVLGSSLPLLGWRYLIDRWLGTGASEGTVELVPFNGVLHWLPFDFIHRLILLAVVVPGVLWLIVGALAARERRFNLAIGLVVANAALFVVWLPGRVYEAFASAGRSSVGLVLAAVVAIPLLWDLPGGTRRVSMAAVVLLTPAWFASAAALAALT